MAETVALEAARGAAFTNEGCAARPGPYRRQTGLAWLSGKGRITSRQAAAGLAYGEAWRRAEAPAPLPSTLALNLGGRIGGGGEPLPVAAIVARAEAHARAGQRLAALRARLGGQAELVAACDAVCGRELTPREAAGGERAALKLEAVLGVALDLLGR